MVKTVKFWQRNLNVENQDMVKKNYDRQKKMKMNSWTREVEEKFKK